MRAAGESTPLLEVEAVSKSYDRREVFAPQSLTLRSGECLLVAGLNGSGKTTFVKILAGLLRPDAGDVRLSGESSVSRAVHYRRRIGLLTDEPLLPRQLTVGEGLAYWGELNRVESARQRVQAALEEVGLAWRQNDPIRILSRGMKQRVSLIAASLTEPELLLLDEPYTGLDEAGRQLVDRAIERQKSRGGLTVLVTHNLERGLGLADRVLVLSRGRGELLDGHSAETTAEWVQQKIE